MTQFVRVCEHCGRIFFVTEAYARHNAARFDKQSCFEKRVARGRGIAPPRTAFTASPLALDNAYKELVIKTLVIAYRDGDHEFLQDENVQVLARWALLGKP